MRKFKCHECNQTWSIAFGEGGRGSEQSCPNCGSHNVHRTGKLQVSDRGYRGSQRRRWSEVQPKTMEEIT
jgi:transposase-like protein